ncbi:serpin family protein, partial [Streptomyces sp. T-3]|nr:serpin family protein [Streptomyces sp. T-3]
LGVAEAEAGRAVTGAARALARCDALAVATGVWSRVPVYRAYREALPDIGFGPMDPQAVDAWVREATGGLIERLPVDVGPDTLLILVNALVLKGLWEDPFLSSGTSESDFTDAAGRVHRVQTMHKRVGVRDAWTVDGARVVELRCGPSLRGTPGQAPEARVRFVLGEPGA